jgi:hypothetical protein
MIASSPSRVILISSGEARWGRRGIGVVGSRLYALIEPGPAVLVTTAGKGGVQGHMDSVVGIAGTVGVIIAMAVVMPLLISGQKKKLAQVEGTLRDRGGMTLNELAAALGTNAVMKGYLMQALDQMVAEGKLKKIPPPAGHPRLRILRDTKYELVS